MKVTERADDGKTYKLASIYEYWPPKIDVRFRLTYTEGAEPISGTCSSNVEGATDSTELGTTDDGTAVVVATTKIHEIHAWEENGKTTMQGRCTTPITEKLEDFYIAVTFDKNTFSIEVCL